MSSENIKKKLFHETDSFYDVLFSRNRPLISLRSVNSDSYTPNHLQYSQFKDQYKLNYRALETHFPADSRHLCQSFVHLEQLQCSRFSISAQFTLKNATFQAQGLEISPVLTHYHCWFRVWRPPEFSLTFDHISHKNYISNLFKFCRSPLNIQIECL